VSLLVKSGFFESAGVRSCVWEPEHHGKVEVFMQCSRRAYIVSVFGKTTGGMVAVALLGVLALFSACVPEPVAELFAAGDLRPPAIASWGPTGISEVTVFFDESIAKVLPGCAASPGPAVLSARLSDDGTGMVVELDAAQSPGAAYAVSAVVADAAGNLSSFVLPYWGYNPDPPYVLINELLTEGSATHPDALEFFVKEGGECAGLSFFVGIPGDQDLRFVFPMLRVEAGDFIVLHLKPQGIDVEINETADKSASGGLDASPGAWDLWYGGENAALSGANGALSLCTSPNGAIMDAVVYSERTIDSDTKYGGFGTASLRDRVASMVTAGVWNAGDPPRPEACAPSGASTSTRTICRSSSSADTDAGADWHIVPTKGASLGTPNSDLVHSP